MVDVAEEEDAIERELPVELGNNGNILKLALGFNHLSGVIPSGIFNMSSLTVISLSNNNFRGPLPSSMWVTLPNIEEVYLYQFTLGGVSPSTISNATNLDILDMGANFLTGPIPSALGNLRFLKRLHLGENNLRRESSSPELRFITSLTNCRQLEIVEISENQLNGFLPSSFGNFSKSLRLFDAFHSKIRGSIPSQIGNLSSLQAIFLDNNELTGFIPSTVGKLKRVDRIYLEHNRLKGSIPTEFCELINLGDLYLNDNMLSGVIPDCLGKLKSLKRVYLQSNNLSFMIPSSFWNLALFGANLSSNSISGQLPSEIQNLKVITELDLSWNQFSGDIPSPLGGALSLIRMSLAHNKFEGHIPQSFGNLISLESLDLSDNRFSGIIPKTLENLKYLKYFNVSFNQLQGEIPSGGPIANFTAQSFMQNYALCGSAKLLFAPCQVKATQESRSKLLKYILPPTASALLIAAIITYFGIRRIRLRIGLSHSEISVLQEWRKISYYELIRATEGFSENNLLGRGSFGTVYRGTLDDGSNVAVKVFHTHSEGSKKSFDAECEVLGSIRHRNLVRILSCCSNQDFKALVLDYIPNGSLEMWLHSGNHSMDILQRLNIAIDVASALEYLHHDHTPAVIHCDLKPSNILLDEDMAAHLCDFSITKLFDEGETMVHTKTLATIGYMAPEYGGEGLVSANGDVYSYGIILLEMFTKRKPTDELFEEDLDSKHWVSESVCGNSIVDVIDRSLITVEDQHYSAKEECMLSILRLAMDCLLDSPAERINARNIVPILQRIKTMLSKRLR